MRESYWERTHFFKQPDVLVIGSGIVGLNAAIELKISCPNWDVVVLERSYLPYGASTRNAGFACFGSVTELEEDIRNVGLEATLDLVDFRYRGLQSLLELLGKEGIGFEPCGGYELFETKEELDKSMALAEELNQQFLGRWGVRFYQNATQQIGQFGFKGVKGMILNTGEGSVNTGKMMQNLLRKATELGVRIINGYPVQEIEKGRVIGEDGSQWRSDRILVCTNGFSQRFFPEEDVKPARAQVLITKPIQGLKVKGTFHYDKGYYYFRNVEDRLLLGGGRNLDFVGETTESMENTDRIMNRLKDLLEETILPGEKFEIDMQWSGVMGVGSRRAPIVKEVEEGVWCAIRMGGMGVAIGRLAGIQAARLVLSS